MQIKLEEKFVLQIEDPAELFITNEMKCILPSKGEEDDGEGGDDKGDKPVSKVKERLLISHIATE